MPAVGQCKHERKRKGKVNAAELPDHEICYDLWVGKLRHGISHMASVQKVVILIKTLTHTIIKENLERLKP